jgi:hypothetical protein
MLFVAVVSTGCIVTSSSPLVAQWRYVETRDMRVIYYDSSNAYVIPHLIRCFENSLRFHRSLWHYNPTQKVSVLLEDFDDYGYAGAATMPYNYLRLGIEPYKYVFETFPTNERFNWVMNHELTHVVATEKSSASDRFYRSLFCGKVWPMEEQPLSMVYSYLAIPRMYAPRWYQEGIAVFVETWMSGGIGRVLGGYDEMVFRSMVRDSSYMYDVVGLQSEGTAIDFQVGANAYLYGTRFLSYLALNYGPDKLLEWYSRTDDSKAFFASQFEHVYGVSLDDAWSRWIASEREWQHANLDSIRMYPVTRFRQLFPRALGSVSRPYYDPVHRKIYAAINYPGQIAHIASIDRDNGTMRKICDVPTSALYYVTSMAFDSSASTLFYTTHNNAEWRHLNAVDVNTGVSRQLIEYSRTGDLAFNKADKSLWGVQHSNGLSVIVRIPPPYDVIYTILPLDYGKDIFDIDIAPDGTYLTGSFLEISGRQRLIRMDMDNLLKGDGSYEVLVEFENNTSPESFVFSPDGRYLYGTSYYTGVSNVFRYDVQTKKRDALTNAETGVFLPLPVSDDSLLAFNYTGQGFVPVLMGIQPTFDISAINYYGEEVVEKHPELKTWKLGSPMTINADSAIIGRGDYDGFRNLSLQAAIPIVEGYKDYTSPGVRISFLDPLQLDALNLTASYSPSRGLPQHERLHLLGDYQTFYWKISAGYNPANFYDLFGPTKFSRKGYFGLLQYHDLLLYDKPRTMDYTIRLAGYGGLETLPEYQNVAAPFDRYISLSAKLDYLDLRKSLGAVDDEAGLTWELNSQNKYVSGKMFPLLNTNLDYGFLLPLDHSFIWLRSSFGYSFQNREDPFANFYFGGFGNNWVDYQPEKRYRESNSFPGVPLNGVGGANYAKGMLEWTLPPARFRHFGVLNAYMTWARLALFSSALVTNLDRVSDRRKLLDVGAQVDFRFVLFSRLDNTLSFGYAAALEQGERATKEFMVSLKIF